MKKKLVNIRDFLKRSESTHTLESASILTEEDCLLDSDLDFVRGGMDFVDFSKWRVELLNNIQRGKDEVGS